MKKWITLTLVLLMGVSLNVKAQIETDDDDDEDVVDTTIVAPEISALDVVEKHEVKQEDKGINSLQYILQKRYKAKGDVFKKGLFKHHFSISAYSGAQRLTPRGDERFSFGHHSGINFNFEVSKLSTFRLGGYLGSYNRQSDNLNLNYYGASLDYLFNFSNLLVGYSTHRILNVSSVLGGSYVYSTLNDQYANVPELYTGLNFSFKVSHNLLFFMEPRASFLGDKIDFSGKSNFRKFDIAYGGLFGLTYKFGASRSAGEADESLLDNTFFSFAFGPQFQNSRTVVNSLGIDKTLGHNYVVSFGKWLIPSFGLRFSLFNNGDYWHKYNDVTEDDGGEDHKTSESKLGKRYEMSIYNGVRAEGMLDWTNLAFGKSDKRMFNSSLLFGVEFGKMEKINGDDLLKVNYTGLTAGLQVAYNLTREVAVFAEPRMTLAYNTIPRTSKFGKVYNYKFLDKLCSFSLGVTVTHPDKKRMLELAPNRVHFDPGFYYSVQLGAGAPIQKIKYKGKKFFDYSVAASAGYKFNSASTARAFIDYDRMEEDLPKTSRIYNVFTGGADYMLNLTNLYSGCDLKRRLDVNVFAGPIFSVIQSKKENIDLLLLADPNANKNKFSSSYGGEIGVQASYRIFSGLFFYAQSKTRFYKKDFLDNLGAFGDDRLTSIQLGLGYNF